MVDAIQAIAELSVSKHFTVSSIGGLCKTLLNCLSLIFVHIFNLQSHFPKLVLFLHVLSRSRMRHERKNHWIGAEIRQVRSLPLIQKHPLCENNPWVTLEFCPWKNFWFSLSGCLVLSLISLMKPESHFQCFGVLLWRSAWLSSVQLSPFSLLRRNDVYSLILVWNAGLLV